MSEASRFHNRVDGQPHGGTAWPLSAGQARTGMAWANLPEGVPDLSIMR